MLYSKNIMKQITINDYYIHYNDLHSFLVIAQEETVEWKKRLFIRQIILKSCFALESLMNQMLNSFSKYKDTPELSNHIEKLATLDKIVVLHVICEVSCNPILIKSENLYSQIKELFRIRNDWVHGKNKSRINVEQDGKMGWIDSSGNNLGDFPYLEIPSGIDCNDATKIPINPFELDVNHGKICLDIVDEIEKRVCEEFNISKDDIHSLTLYDEDGNKIGVYPISMVWGVYSPKK